MILTWISTGCYMPINRFDNESREYFPAYRDDFTPNKTTRAEVLLIMGEPDEKSPDETLLIYRWRKIVGVGTNTGCDTHEIIETTLFKFTFDSEGVFKSLNITLEE